MVQGVAYTPETVLLRRVDYVLSPAYPDPMQLIAMQLDAGKKIEFPKVDTAETTQRMDAASKLLTLYERAQKSGGTSKAETNRVDYSDIAATLAFSAGAVALLLLAIQIAIVFVRYYVQLSELYEDRASALDAANGDIDVAVRLMDAFSKNAITLGKSPVTLYERSLDAATEVVKARIK
ncbi:hypothetical protein PHO31112_02320 [Pandoraea horticolens]|uniref:Uncharacterized protein n=2 Tax=Pandoraea horticolens TaxID=2508298 RepID=A0A5E4UYS6_9BURK|nr:hypothetical protein PHO31112_02320 [Pandoraea horticolens]